MIRRSWSFGYCLSSLSVRILFLFVTKAKELKQGQNMSFITFGKYLFV